MSTSLQLHGLQHARHPFTISRSLLKFTSIESVMLSNHLSLPLSSPFAFNLSQHQGLFQWPLCIKWPKYWSSSISPSNEYSGLISFRINWFDLLAAQGTLKSLLQHHSSKASILQCLAFFMVQFSHLYMTTGNYSFDYTDLCWQSNVSANNCLSLTHKLTGQHGVMYIVVLYHIFVCLILWTLSYCGLSCLKVCFLF